MTHVRRVCVVVLFLLGTVRNTSVHGEDTDEAGSNYDFKYEAVTKYPFQDPTLPWSTRIDHLVARLTLDEIVPQTNAVIGSNPPILRLGIKPYVWTTECLHGQCSTNTTAFPQPIGLSASFR